MTEERRLELKTLVNLPMVGEDGNAFAILGRATKAMRRAGFTIEERTEFTDEATSGDYNHLLATTMEFFDTSGDDEEEDCDCPNCS